jgi:hypothetical protein
MADGTVVRVDRVSKAPATAMFALDRLAEITEGAS